MVVAAADERCSSKSAKASAVGNDSGMNQADWFYLSCKFADACAAGAKRASGLPSGLCRAVV
jgi:hypothetical protein